jgi:hypothetical protein
MQIPPVNKHQSKITLTEVNSILEMYLDAQRWHNKISAIAVETGL